MDVFTLSHGLQAISTFASIGKVATKDNYVVSRGWNATALVAVTADLFQKYTQDHDGASLGGLLTFIPITTRSLLIWGLNFDDKNPRHLRWQQGIAAGTFVIGMAASIGGQLYFKGAFDPRTVLPLGGLFFGCWADATNSLVSKRRRFLLMGLCTGSYAAMTGAWGLLGKNLVSDIGASLYYARRYQDPLPDMRPLAGRIRFLASRVGHLRK